MRAGTRDQAARDAVTVEIVFAVVTGALLAGVLLVIVAAPALFGDPAAAEAGTWVKAGATVAAAGFVWRVVRVLRRFAGAGRA
ncbi:DUF6332 family protein [Streptomyces sp. NPDC018031]|uniref:DUF6332 family protein n=1 Tax=Streptomyces sp. NPDC018031 TaxID=3365033 RepID=UPI00378E3830